MRNATPLAAAAIAGIVLSTACGPGYAAPPGLEDALNAGDLICDFRTGYSRALIADLGRGSAAGGLMLLYEAIDPQRERAQVVSTQSAGRTSVVLSSTSKALHLIEERNASVRVTTLTACLDWRVKRGVEACVRFAARHAWHFDATVRADPDASDARQRRGALSGHCEPWTLD